ncbi:acetyl-CoA carboxylase [Agrobacterium larrymoorei]|uniref:acetyl-CoA carboxylase n=1 Tax=Agrobacterium larrymoorei TaxID=160699 RepID=UPI001571DF4E|nr:acetyl-CoA carboxylase [Agrobacterium larrymoorei]NTJ44550.1 acetyl-CoA carboxylase [Agrobacterium larrymoorei]
MSRLDFTDPATLAALTDMLKAAGVDGLEITTPDAQVKLVVSASQGSAKHASNSSARPTATANFAVKARIAGHFHVASGGDETFPYSVAGDAVVGFIRIGHVLVPVFAGRAGLLTGRLVEHGALVGFGDPLFEIESHS